MVTVNSREIEIDGVEFDISFQITGDAVSDAPNHPGNSVRGEFHSMLVYAAQDRAILIDTERDARACIGDKVFQTTLDVALDIYIDEISDDGRGL